MSAHVCRAAVGIALALAATVAFANKPGAPAVSLKLAEAQLMLEERGAVCFMKGIGPDGKERAFSLDIPGPCAFHKDKRGAIRTIRHGKYEYALVESAKQVNVAPSECETHLRSIRAAGRKFQISQHKDKVASCPPFQWDRLLFTALFD